LITAVDTSVLLDIFGADAKLGELSSAARRRCLAEGALVACEAVWAETAAAFTESKKFKRAMTAIPVTFAPLSEVAAIKPPRPGAATARTADRAAALRVIF